MLDLADKSLAAGSDPGDVKSNLQGLLSASQQTASQVQSAVTEALASLAAAETLLSEDFSLGAELASIDRVLAEVSF